MRTTLTLDPDVAKKLKALAHLRRKPFKQTLNEILRRGFGSQEITLKDPYPSFVVKAHRGGFRPGIDVEKLNQLTEDIETQHFVQRQRRTR